MADAATVLDGYDIAAAHMVGMSMGGGLAQLLVLDSPDRVLSLVLMSTSPAVPGERDLPRSDASLGRFLATAEVDWADEASVRDYLVDYWRVLWGAERTFDETHILDLVQRDVERANDPAAAPNHGLVDDDDESAERGPLRSITAPTLVIHGTADPMFPLAHGEALAAEIPGARLLALDGAGHCVDPADWELVTGAILDHTREGAGPTR